jgi:hypothetical protein
VREVCDEGIHDAFVKHLGQAIVVRNEKPRRFDKPLGKRFEGTVEMPRLVVLLP